MAKEGNRSAGCFVSCCMGWTIGIVAVVLLALLILLVMFTFPFVPRKACSTLMRSPPSPSADQLWQQCDEMASSNNSCIGSCERAHRPITDGTESLLPPVIPDPRPLPTSAPLTNVRLNQTWAPRHYNLLLQPWVYNASDARLNGSVEIFMMSAEATNVIVLHALNLTVNQSTMELRERNAEGKKIRIKDFEVDEPRQFIRIFTYGTLSPSREFYLKMDFNGTLLHPLRGFYRATYSQAGAPRYLAVTQFEEAEARRAFPCFDEPSFKATFTVTLVRREDFTALSNTDLETTRSSGIWRWDTFKKTPIMSTYILAMFVGQYVHRERTTPRGTRVRVWTQPNFIQYAKVPLEVTGKIIEAFEDYTGIKYPLNKTDQLAIREFSAGAMENWGLIVYSEGQFLVNPAASTTVDRRNSVNTIAHELAHQWFGNLVTMRWWEDTFLNEAFATYMGNYVGVPSVRPSWNQPVYFIKKIQEVMKVDTAPEQQPIRLAGLSPNDNLKKAFSDITYTKGAAILRMFRYFMKEDTFKRAIQSYLREFSYTNAVKEDLVNVLNRQARIDSQVTWSDSRATLSEIATSWLDQANYPLLEVTDLKRGRVRVKQSRFVSSPVTESPYLPPFSNYSWHIPLTYANSVLLNRQGYTMRWIYRDDVVNFEDLQVTGWKLANIFFQGFYRVWYDPDTWNSIIHQLEKERTLIPVESRSEIIDDAFALAAEGYTNEVRALRTTRFLANETEYIVFRPFFEGRLKQYLRLLRGTPSYSYLISYVSELIKPSYDRLGWVAVANEPIMDKDLRLLVLTEACARQYQPCVFEALNQFQKYKRIVEQSPSAVTVPDNPIDPDLRPLVYCTAMRHGGVDVLTFLVERIIAFRFSGDFLANDLTAVILGIICAEEPASFDSMIQWAFSTNISAILEAIASQSGVADILWNYIDTNWARIPPQINREDIIWLVTEFFGTESDLQKLRHFLQDHITEINPIFSEELIAKVKDNVNWVKRNEPGIRDWLMYGRHGLLPPTSRRQRRSADLATEERLSDYRHPTMGSGHKSARAKSLAIFESREDLTDLSFSFWEGKLKANKRNSLVHHVKNWSATEGNRGLKRQV